MRRILIENARRKRSLKHGGGWQRREMDAGSLVGPEPDADLLALDAALHRLAEHDPLKAGLVELRYFGGLTGDQAAAVLASPPATPIGTGSTHGPGSAASWASASTANAGVRKMSRFPGAGCAFSRIRVEPSTVRVRRGP
jgi:hypothetical protein